MNAAARAGDPSQLLDPDEVHRFWDARHAAETDLRSGGDVGLSEDDNAIFYQIRLGLLLQALAAAAPLPPGTTVLDAGCGKGWFSRALASVGIDVHGVDASPAAVEFARKAGGTPTYEVATLAGVRPLRFVDAVVSVDVMFHIVDDDEWAASVANLSSVVRPGGLLVVTDTTAEIRKRLGVYIVHRPRAEYVQLLSGRGFQLREVLPYRFRSNPLGFHVYERMW